MGINVKILEDDGQGKLWEEDSRRGGGGRWEGPAGPGKE